VKPATIVGAAILEPLSIKRIVVGMDFSEGSDAAMVKAFALALAHYAVVDPVHVVELGVLFAPVSRARIPRRNNAMRPASAMKWKTPRPITPKTRTGIGRALVVISSKNATSRKSRALLVFKRIGTSQRTARKGCAARQLCRSLCTSPRSFPLPCRATSDLAQRRCSTACS
jgi:universal stress protein family protein